jgi:hypothetical protein
MKVNRNIWGVDSGKKKIALKASLRARVRKIGFEMHLYENNKLYDNDSFQLWLVVLSKIEIALLGDKRGFKKLFKNLGKKQNENLSFK